MAGQSRITSRFGWRRHPVGGKRRAHRGVDIAARSGTPILAISYGKVVFAGWKPGFGRTVEIAHGLGWLTRYAHARKILVTKGQSVLAGQMIAQVGRSGVATGSHLHFELLQADRNLNPLELWRP